MQYHQQAQYADGSPSGVSGREADDRYAPVKVLTEIGAEVVFHGDVVADQPPVDLSCHHKLSFFVTCGDKNEEWDGRTN